MTTTTTERTRTLLDAYKHWLDCNTFLLSQGRSHSSILELATTCGTPIRTAYRHRRAWLRIVGE